jgi:acyl-CoA synthetase
MTNTLLTLHDPATARRYYAEELWRDDTFYTLLQQHTRQRPDAYALRDATARLSWGELLTAVDAVAADLDHAGLKRGERVAVWLPNRVEAVVVFLACSRNGYVCNPSLHQNYTVAEIVTLLERTQAAALFAQPGHGADARTADIFAAARELPFLRRVYTLGDAAADRDAEPTPFPTGPGLLPVAETNPDQVVYLAFTSGTTGTPKGVMHSANTLFANARAMVADWGHDNATVLLSLSPLSHHIAIVAVAQAMTAGMELVVNSPPAGMTPLDWIVHSGATYVMGVPTHAMDILGELRRRELAAGTRESLGQVKTFYMAGSVIPREVAQALLDRGVTPQNVYGMSENSSHQYTLPNDSPQTIVATCGRSCAAYEIELWDQENPDIEVAPGEVGEIGGRGACLMLGYFDNQRATEESFNRFGWFMSGDLGRFDGNGNLEIVGRKKDLIIRGGHNIHPARIEELAMRHKSVARCAAFAVVDGRLGEKVCLSVIWHDGESADAGAMLAHLHAEGLSKYDMPEYFIAMDAYPLTASGKILKRELVEWAKSGRIAPTPVRWAEG